MSVRGAIFTLIALPSVLPGGPVNVCPSGVSVWTTDSMTRVMRTTKPEQKPPRLRQ